MSVGLTDVDCYVHVSRSPNTTASNKCRLMNWNDKIEIVAEGRWLSQY